MIDEATYDDLDRYFQSTMTAEERSAFELQLNAREELRAELNWLVSMQMSMSTQGKAVMKQVVAGAIAGVAGKEVAKYKPSLNRKTFLQKWWWMIAAGTVILAAAAWFAIVHYATPEENCLDCVEQNSEVLPGISTNMDSVTEAMKAIDTLGIDDGEAANALPEHREKVFVNLGQLKNQQPNVRPLVQSEVAKEPKVGARVDTIISPDYSWDTETPDSVNKQRPMDILFRPDPKAKAAYIFNGQMLTLIGPYASSAGLVFSAQGDSLIMRDDKPGYFVLRKTAIEKPLERKAGSNRGN